MVVASVAENQANAIICVFFVHAFLASTSKRSLAVV